ncbi:N-6 DNA methylase [Enterococcus sp. LJL128]
MKLTTEIINQLLQIDDSYKAPAALMKFLFDKEQREELFRQFLAIENRLDYEWFQSYFENEHADRKNKKQDFTPDSISQLLSKLTGNKSSSLDIAAGTGGLTIQKWEQDRMNETIATYKPSMFLYQCEELSDRAIPFLLFNLMIRGMNALVVHGDSISREVKQVYFVQNDNDDFMYFSSLNVMPQSDTVTKEFEVEKWIEDPIQHVESPIMPQLEVS